MALTVNQSPQGVTSSIDCGYASAPAANTILCDSGPLSAGNNQPMSYFVIVATHEDGTVDATKNNMFLNVGGTNTGGVLSGGTTLGALSSANAPVWMKMRVSVQPGQHIYVCTGNSAGGAGSIYIASLSCTRAYNPYADI